MSKPFNLIVACSTNRVIGREGRLPWRIPEDWAFFKQQTTGKVVILGRVTFEAWKSFHDEPRHAIVVTRDRTLAGAHVDVASSLSAALALAARRPEDVYVAGGERLFAEAMTLPEAQRLYLTLVHAEVSGDRYFPDWRETFPRVVAARDSADANFRYRFEVREPGNPQPLAR